MQQVIPNYSFDPGNRSITLPDLKKVDAARLIIVVNVTLNKVIYCLGEGAPITAIGNTVNIDPSVDLSGHRSSDKLQIRYVLGYGEADYQKPTNVDTERKTWKRNFSSPEALAAHWDVAASGGASASVTAGEMRLVTGLTANAQASVTSKESFSMPFRAQITARLSQRIANQSFYVELVNAAGDTFVGWLFDGTAPTTCKLVQANSGQSAPSSPSGGFVINTTANANIWELDCRADGILWNEVPADNAAVKQTRQVRTRTILDPGEDYFVRIRCVNSSAAPASSTTFTVDCVLVQDMAKLVAEISGGRGVSGASSSVPVVLNGGNVSVGGTVSTNLPSLTPFSYVTTAAYFTAVPRAAGVTLAELTISNTSGATAYVKLFDKATAPVASDVPRVTIPVPAGSMIAIPLGPTGKRFGNGLAIAVSGAIAANDVSAGPAGVQISGTHFS